MCIRDSYRVIQRLEPAADHGWHPDPGPRTCRSSSRRSAWSWRRPGRRRATRPTPTYPGTRVPGYPADRPPPQASRPPPPAQPGRGEHRRVRARVERAFARDNPLGLMVDLPESLGRPGRVCGRAGIPCAADRGRRPEDGGGPCDSDGHRPQPLEQQTSARQHARSGHGTRLARSRK